MKKFIILLISAVLVVELALSVNGQTVDGKCGSSNGANCGSSYCCSQYGYCGTSVDYCGAGCQVGFGICNSGTTTTTATTTSTTTTKASTTTSVPPTSTTKAVEITTCSVPGTVAITFDDGPSEFTHSLLDELKANNVKATFFVNGNNYGCIYDYADIITRAVNEGHQIASHTWSHPDLATLTKAQITYQMQKLEEAFTKILGKIPTYMRPPFGSYNDLVMTTIGGLGYRVITWDTDTNDWQGRTTDQCLAVYNNAPAPPKSHIVLNHDTIENTVINVAPQAYQLMLTRGFKINTVGQCLGESDSSKWYRTVGAPQPKDSTWVCSSSDISGP